MSKKNIDKNIQNRISDVLKKLTKEESGNNQEVVNLLLDIQKNNPQLSSNFNLEELFDCMQNAVVIYEAVDNGEDFKIVGFNAAAEKIEDLKKKEIIGKKVTKVFPGIVEFGLLDVLKDVWKTGDSMDHPVSIYEDDRIKGWRENYVYKLPTGEIVAVYRDVTEQKQAEEQVIHSELNLQTLINNRKESIWSIDKDYNFIVFNDFFKEHYFVAYKIKLEIGINALDVVTEDLYDFWKAKYDRALSGEKYSFEFTEDIEETTHYFEVSLNPIISNKTITGVSAFSIDITERKQTDEAIRISEENYKGIFNTSSDAIYIQDKNGIFIDVNEGVEKMYGYKRNSFIGKTPEFISAPGKNDINAIMKAVTNAYNGKEQEFEYWGLRKSGEAFPKEVKLYPGKYNGEKVVIAVAHDISERKKSKEALRESEERYKEIVLNLRQAYYEADNKGLITHCNSELFLFTGYTERELIGRRSFSIVHREHWAKVIEEYQKCLREKTKNSTSEFKATMKNGENYWIEQVSNFHYDEEGNFIKVTCVVKDITERKEAEEALRESEELFRSLATSTSIAIFIHQNDKIVFVNKSTEELTGYSQNEMLKMNFWEIVLPEYKDIIKERGHARQEGKKVPERYQLEIFKKDGSKAWIDLSAGVIKWKGKIASIGSAVDITNQKNIEKELKKNEEKYRLITSLTSDYLFSTFINENGESIANWVGGSFEKITGYTFEEYKKVGGWGATLHPDDLAKDREAFEKIKNNKKVKFEVRTFHKSGKIVWVKTFGSPVWDEKKDKLIGINGACTDITKEKLASIALEEREEKYKLISNITSDYLFESRFNKNNILETIWVAGSFEKMTGFQLEEYQEIGGWSQLLHKKDVAIDLEAFEKLQKNNEAILEVRTHHKNGRIIWVRNTCTPLWDKKNDKLLGVVGAVKDITEEKQNEILHEIQYNIANAIVSTQSTAELFELLKKELNKIIDATNFYIAFYDEKSGMLISEIDDDEKDNIETWAAEKSISGYLINSGKSLFFYKEEIIKLAQCGEINIVGTIPEVWLGVPLKIRDTVVGIMAVQNYDNSNAYDEISIELFELIGNQLSLYLERNRAKEDASRLSRAIVQSPSSVVITNLDGEIDYVNPKFEKVSGFTFKEVLGKNPNILKSGTMPGKFYKNLWKTILAGKDWRGEFHNKRKNGELYWENAVISPIENDNGQITHFVAIKEDITEKKKMIEELISSKEKAEVSEKIKTEFLAQMSHEIRSPLNVILSFVGLLKEDLAEIASEDMMSGFESIDSASSRITRTIDLILNMTDLQLGSYESSIEEINVEETLNRIKSEYNQSAIRKGLELKLNMQFSSKIIISDKYAILQIVSNLVDNAIKYSDKGFIEIFTFNNEKKDLVIKVKDTGIGMSEEFLPNIFNSFSQEEQGYTRSYDGNGLGMALVKNYCDIISVDISVKSIKGEGTTFTLVIPSLKK